jgi:uncharacterized membrane protein (UPF0136 family)
MFTWIVRQPMLVLLLVLTFLFLAGDGPRIIQYPPRATHQFRQSDCLAYTKTYYQRNTGLFSPSAYNLIGRGGRVVSEFPVLYYLSAKLCKLFGFHYWVIRGVTFLCYILGLFYLFGISRLWIKNLLPSLFPVIIMAASPFYFFYAVNYLPNVPAISFSFAGLYHLLQYRRGRKVLHVVAGTLYFVLAMLLKPTDGGLILAGYMAVAMLWRQRATKEENKFINRTLLAVSATVLAGILSWYFFVKGYNETNHNQINLQGIYPIWIMTWDEIYGTLYFRLLSQERNIFHHSILCALLLVMLIIFIVRWRRLDSFLRQFTLSLIISSLIYLTLWFNAFNIHDYYLLVLVVPAVFLSITIIEYWCRVVLPFMKRKVRYVMYTLAAGLIVMAIYHNQSIQLMRYGDKNASCINSVVYEVEPYLRKIGISASDSVLCVPDGTPNGSLAAFGNPGYTSDLFGAGTYNVPFCRKNGIRYMIIIDAAYIYDTAYAAYTSKLIGQYKDIHIYDIR